MKAVPMSTVAPRRWLARAVALSAAAGLIHTLMTPIYFGQWLGYGAFFFAAATLQVIYAALLAVNPCNRGVLWLGIAGNSALIATWLITRTIGIPFFGPEAGQVQPVGVVDLVTQLIELALIVHLAVVLRALPELGDRPLIE